MKTYSVTFSFTAEDLHELGFRRPNASDMKAIEQSIADTIQESWNETLEEVATDYGLEKRKGC